VHVSFFLSAPLRARGDAENAGDRCFSPPQTLHTHAVLSPIKNDSDNHKTPINKKTNSTEKPNGQPNEVFQALCPYCGGVNAARSWSEAAPSDLSVPGVFVHKGKSWLDNDPVWVFNYDKAQRSFGFEFKGFRDELRQAAPGMLIGKMFMEPTNSTFVNGWNPSDRATEMTSFVLLQVNRFIYLSY
jgi:hypothetical protein